MSLGNIVETIVHYLLIGGMDYLGCQDEVLMVSALVCMVTHWIVPIVNHDTRLSTIMIHQATILHGL